MYFLNKDFFLNACMYMDSPPSLRDDSLIMTSMTEQGTKVKKLIVKNFNTSVAQQLKNNLECAPK